jgi:hypothetical protein
MPRRQKQAPPPEFSYSLHKAGGWRGQWDRIHRWHSRLMAGAAADREDFLYAFFQNCAFLPEWLRRDRPPGLRQSELEAFIKNHVELRLCQDIANATKHFALDDPKMPREFSAAREYVPAPIRGGKASAVAVVLADGVKYDALMLAGRCLEIWRSFLSERGLDV